MAVVLTRVWAIELPLPANAPVMLPGGNAATIQEKVVPATSLVSTIFVTSVEQRTRDEGVAVKTGVGLTVIVNVWVGPSQLTPPLLKCGVTTMLETFGTIPLFEATKEAISPVPKIGRPIVVLSLVQL